MRISTKAPFGVAGALLLGIGCARERPAELPIVADDSAHATMAAMAPNALTAAPLETAEAQPELGVAFQAGTATYYADRFRGRATANGEKYDPGALTAAHRTLPFGTLVEVRRSDGRGRVVVRINDRGPYAHGAIIDLSGQAAAALGMVDEGIVRVELRLVRRR